MRLAVACLALCGFVGAAAGVAEAAIDVQHEAVGCIVAGEHPQLDACFTPAASVARARLYFRLESAPTWYYVEMNSRVPCWSGALPKPKKDLISQRLQYYVQVFDTSMGEGRSPEHSPLIVGSKGECSADALVAPISAAGPAAVFPAMPAGFASGLGATPFVLGGVGAAAAGGTVVALAGDDDPPPGPAPVPPPVVTPEPPPLSTPPPPPVPALDLACKAEPASGEPPLAVKFFAYPTGGDGIYDYLWSFGTGAESHEKNPSYTYAALGVYPVNLTVTSAGQTKTCNRTVKVERTSKLTLATAWNADSFGGLVTSVPAGIACDYNDGVTTGVCNTVFAGPLPISIVLTLVCDETFTAPSFESGCDSVTGNTCAISATGPRVVDVACFYSMGGSSGLPVSASIRASVEAQGGRGRVTVDGAGMAALETGAAREVSFEPRGVHRVEAVVDEARGPGLARFDLTEAGVADGSLRVLAGDVVQVSPGEVVFRVSGKAGERLSFAFTTTRRDGPGPGAPRR